MDRVKFCPECDEVLPWDTTNCKACGAPVPEDPKAFEKARARKERELERLRREAAARPAIAERPPRQPVLRTTTGYVSPTGKAVRIAFWSFFGGLFALLFAFVGEPSTRLRSLAYLAGWVLLAVCNLAVLWVIIHSAVVSAIRVTREE